MTQTHDIGAASLSARRTVPHLDYGVAWAQPEVGRRRLAALHSDLVGIAHRTFGQLHDHDDAALAAVGAQACRSEAVLGAGCNELNGGGHQSLQQATAAAIGETAERYSVAWRDPEDLIIATPETLRLYGARHTEPEELTLFAEEQHENPAFPYVPLEEDTSVTWAAGTDLADQSVRLVPADLVYMVPSDDPHHMIGYPTSNGLACGSTLEEATLGGLLELVERDAFVTTWYRMLSLPQIEIDSDPQLAAFFATHLEQTGLEVTLIDLSALVEVPTVLAVIRNPHNEIAPLALGAAASTDPVRACEKAAIEAFQTRTWAMSEQRAGAILDPDEGFEQVRTFDDHVRMSLHPRSIEAAAFLTASTQTVAVDDLPRVPDETPGAAIREIMSRLSSQETDGRGVDATAVDVTSPDIAEAGLSVVKVFSAALSPLDSGWHQRYMGGQRIRQRPQQVGLGDGPVSTAELNPRPHPFP